MPRRTAVFRPPRTEYQVWCDLQDRDFPEKGAHWIKGVCKRCGLIMTDFEPASSHGEFRHFAQPHQTRALRCVNKDETFDMRDAELVPFLRKSRRRFLNRVGIRA